MKFIWLIFISSIFIVFPGSAQELTQVVKGRVADRLTGVSLAGASIRLTGAAEVSALSDADGFFEMRAAIGRYKISVTFTGYKPYHDEALVIAGRQNQLNIGLIQTETILETVEVQSSTVSTDLPGLETVSIEKTMRAAANFFDPVRMITSYPGVVAASDQNNSIIVRGNSPNGLLWRLNGLDIVNPNHLANAGTFSDRPASNGGGVNILSAQMLDRTNFYMGALPANLGNALAGAIEMNFREGNKAEHEFTAQASLIGLDVSAEGPLGKSDKNSFVTNYRYSTVGLLSAIGVNFGDEAISFQDLSFHADFDQDNGGQLSVFGMWGASANKFESKETEDWEEDKDRYDIDFDAVTYVAGLSYQVPVGRGRFEGGLAYSQSQQERHALISDLVPNFERGLQRDDYDATNGIVSTSVKFASRLGASSSFEIGVMTNMMQNDLTVYRLFGCGICSFAETQEVTGDADAFLIQPHLNYTIELSPVVNLDAGVRYMNYTYNRSSAIDPRISIAVRPGGISGLNFAYSLVSQLQQPIVYFSQGNEDLGMTRAHHADVNYWQHISRGLKLKGGVFYQALFDVPIEDDPTSTFSVINLLDEIPPGNLVNRGTGENYGVDVTLEKYFFSNTSLLLGANYYESTYTAADGVKRNTRFNGNYTFTSVYGKEWNNAGKNRTIGLSTRLLYLGGLRESAVNIPASLLATETVYDSSDPFSEKLEDYFRIDLKVYFRKNKPGYTRTFAIDIQNVLNNENEAYHYYDKVQQGTVTKYQLGIIPVLVYRIDF